MATRHSPQQPKINRRLVVRTVALLFGLAILIAGFQFYRSLGGDAEQLVRADTVGAIAALEMLPDGQRAVVIGADGKIRRDEGWKQGVRDRDLAWQPDGNFLFFVSNRRSRNYDLFRWSPARDTATQMTQGTRSRGNPQFPAPDVENANRGALITTGGAVFEFETDTKNTPQVLPPASNEITKGGNDGESGAEGQIAAIYGTLGKSFKIARYCQGRRFIAAVMRREVGEVLILQDMTPNSEGKIVRPVPVAAGERVDFDVNPRDGSIVLTVQGFQWPDPAMAPPQFRKGNRITTPGRHMLALFHPESGLAPIGLVPDDRASFGSPAISPDGSVVCVVAGPYEENNGIVPKELLVVPCTQAGIQANTRIVQGTVFEPAWSPDGERLVFARREANGARALFTIAKDGSNETRLPVEGNFSNPKFSPQRKSSG